MRTTCIPLAVVIAASASAQFPDSLSRDARDWKRDEISLLIGYQQGRFGFAEIGIGRSIYGAVHHPFGIGYHAGAELRADRPSLIGWKVGAYMTGGMAMGIHAIHYQDGAAGCTVIRPEIGIGVLKAKLTYAYNVDLSRSRIEGISTHLISIAYALRLSRLSNDAQR